MASPKSEVTCDAPPSSIRCPTPKVRVRYSSIRACDLFGDGARRRRGSTTRSGSCVASYSPTAAAVPLRRAPA